MLNTFSKKFFSMCITSRLCRMRLVLQYGKSQNMLLFFQPENLLIRRLIISAPSSVTFLSPSSSISYKTSSPDRNGVGCMVTTLFFLNELILSIWMIQWQKLTMVVKPGLLTTFCQSKSIRILHTICTC